MSVRVTLHPTSTLGAVPGGVVLRKWVGFTDGGEHAGHVVEAWIACIGLDERAPAPAHEEFEAALLALEPELLNLAKGRG